MLECFNCGEWFHGGCVGITETEAEHVNVWACDQCKGVPQSQGGPLLGRPRQACDNKSLLPIVIKDVEADYKEWFSCEYCEYTYKGIAVVEAHENTCHQNPHRLVAAKLPSRPTAAALKNLDGLLDGITMAVVQAVPGSARVKGLGGNSRQRIRTVHATTGEVKTFSSYTATLLHLGLSRGGYSSSRLREHVVNGTAFCGWYVTFEGSPGLSPAQIIQVRGGNVPPGSTTAKGGGAPDAAAAPLLPARPIQRHGGTVPSGFIAAKTQLVHATTGEMKTFSTKSAALAHMGLSCGGRYGARLRAHAMDSTPYNGWYVSFPESPSAASVVDIDSSAAAKKKGGAGSVSDGTKPAAPPRRESLLRAASRSSHGPAATAAIVGKMPRVLPPSIVDAAVTVIDRRSANHTMCQEPGSSGGNPSDNGSVIRGSKLRRLLKPAARDYNTACNPLNDVGSVKRKIGTLVFDVHAAAACQGHAPLGGMVEGVVVGTKKRKMISPPSPAPLSVAGAPVATSTAVGGAAASAAAATSMPPSVSSFLEEVFASEEFAKHVESMSSMKLYKYMHAPLPPMMGGIAIAPTTMDLRTPPYFARGAVGRSDGGGSTASNAAASAEAGCRSSSSSMRSSTDIGMQSATYTTPKAARAQPGLGIPNPMPSAMLTPPATLLRA